MSIGYTFCMYIFNEPSALVGVSELRTHFDKILQLAKKTKVFLGKRQKPMAVLVPIEKYDQMAARLDELEDLALGYVAKKRQKTVKANAYISLAEAEQLVGLKK